MFPLEEGFGEPWFPIVRAGTGQRRVGGRIFANASASREWAECLQLPNSDACMAGFWADSTR